MSDPTDSEILHFIAAKGDLVHSRNSKIDNPIGFLVAAVPKCFEGESFRQYRAHLQGREARPEDPTDVQRYRNIVDDPNASEPEKRVALAVLAKT